MIGKDLKKGETAVLLDTKEKIEDFLKECDKNDIKWSSGDIATGIKYRCDDISETSYCCLEGNSKLGYSTVRWHESKGKEIVQWNIEENENVEDNKMKTFREVIADDRKDVVWELEGFEIRKFKNGDIDLKTPSGRRIGIGND